MPLWFLDLRLDSDYLTSIIVILGIWSKSAATGAVTVIYGGLSHCYDHCARSYLSSRRWLPIIIIPMPAITVMIIILASTVIPFFLPFSLLTLLFPSLLFVFALFLHSLFLLATRLFQPVLRSTHFSSSRPFLFWSCTSSGCSAIFAAFVCFETKVLFIVFLHATWLFINAKKNVWPFFCSFALLSRKNNISLF